LVDFISRIVALLQSPTGEALLSLMAAQAPELIATREAFWQKRFENALVIFQDARSGVKSCPMSMGTLFFKALVAPIYFRALISRATLSEFSVDELVDRSCELLDLVRPSILHGTGRYGRINSSRFQRQLLRGLSPLSTTRSISSTRSSRVIFVSVKPSSSAMDRPCTTYQVKNTTFRCLHAGHAPSVLSAVPQARCFVERPGLRQAPCTTSPPRPKTPARSSPYELQFFKPTFLSRAQLPLESIPFWK
jgi:hypothetical protein